VWGLIINFPCFTMKMGPEAEHSLKQIALEYTPSGPSLGKNMYYVYVLKSIKDDKLYIGYTTDLKRRLKEHNTLSSKATKPRLPLKLVYYEAYLSEKDAKEREFKLKRFSGSYTHLKHRIKNSLILSK